MSKKQLVVLDARDQIMEKLTDIERNLHWLSRKTGISYDTLYSCIKKKLFSLSQDNLSSINETLGTNFTIKG